MLSATPHTAWFSLGADCQASYHLKRRGIRTAKLPFDWALSTHETLSQILERDFAGLFEDDSTQIVSHEGRQVVLDSRYGLRLPHDVERFQRYGSHDLRDRYGPGISALRRTLSSECTLIFIRRNSTNEEADWILHHFSQRRLSARTIVASVRAHEGPASCIQQAPNLFEAWLPRHTGWMGSTTAWDQLIDRLAAEALGVKRLWACRYLLNIDWAALFGNAGQTGSMNLTREVEDRLVAALVAGEDHRFFRHRGIDGRALGRAAFGLATGTLRGGGSTIEQQLFRTLTGRRERTALRKVRELAGAHILSARFDKRRLALGYLDKAYYGWQMNGLRQACQRLGLSQNSLTEHDCARIVAHLKYPAPQLLDKARAKKIQERTEHIERRMSALRTAHDSWQSMIASQPEGLKRGVSA